MAVAVGVAAATGVVVAATTGVAARTSPKAAVGSLPRSSGMMVAEAVEAAAGAASNTLGWVMSSTSSKTRDGLGNLFFE